METASEFHRVVLVGILGEAKFLDLKPNLEPIFVHYGGRSPFFFYGKILIGCFFAS